MVNIALTNHTNPLVTVSEPDSEVRVIVSDEIRGIVESALNFLIFVFGLMGVVTNAINIRVFVQQGVLSDSSTIGLFSLAVADLLGCVFLLPSSFCDVLRYVFTARPELVLSCMSWYYLLFPIPHIAMSRLTCWVTVYIAVERCLCVLVPFKVKLLARPKVTMAVMVFLYVNSFVIYFPLFVNTGIVWIKYHTGSGFNVTVAFYTETALAKVIRNYMSLILNTVMSTVAVIVVAIATGLMLFKLNRIKQWRQRTAHVGSSHIMSSRAGDSSLNLKKETAQEKKDAEVLKIVVMVTGLFLVCLSMSHFPGFASALVPGFSVTGTNKNIFYILYLYKFVFDVINSSLNFFFYIRLSSRYKVAYNQVFKRISKVRDIKCSTNALS